MIKIIWVIIIKRITNILFFILLLSVVCFVLDKLGIINFIIGFIKVLFPVGFGFFISFVLERIISKLILKGYNRKKVVIITYIGLLLFIILLLVLFVPSLVKQINIFIETLPSLINNVNGLLAKYNLDITKMIDFKNIKFEKIFNYIGEGVRIVIDLGITVSTAFFVSYDYERVKERIKQMIPSIIKNEVLYFFKRYIPFFSKYVYSLLIDSAITFTISFFLFTIFGVEYSLVGSLLITITNLIPYVGPIIGVIPLVVIGYSVSTYFAIVSLVIVLIVQLIESNIIQPLIFKNVIHIHPVEGIIGILIFSYLFSFWGMLLAPLLVVAFKLLFIEKYNKESQVNEASIQ